MIKRTEKVEIKTELPDDDPRRIELVDIMIAQKRTINNLEETYKKPLKAAKEKFNEALKELEEGFDDEEEVTLYIDPEKKTVVPYKDGERHGDIRGATEEDLIPHMDDRTVKNIGD
jgi:hypothetical protein